MEGAAAGARWSDGSTFFTLNPGVLYPAVHGLAERALAAAESSLSFKQTAQHRLALLTDQPNRMAEEPLPISSNSVPASARARFGSGWPGPGLGEEGLASGALPAIKRLWPTLFAEEVAQVLGREVRRLVACRPTPWRWPGSSIGGWRAVADFHRRLHQAESNAGGWSLSRCHRD